MQRRIDRSLSGGAIEYNMLDIIHYRKPSSNAGLVNEQASVWTLALFTGKAFYGGNWFLKMLGQDPRIVREWTLALILRVHQIMINRFIAGDAGSKNGAALHHRSVSTT